jgi:L-alanine-DL-glutamate epimerase-like enolase superfamily enzyme
MDTFTLSTRKESWPLAKPFTISRGTKTVADVVVVELMGEDGIKGWAECVPYPRYDETVDGVIAQIEAESERIASGISREELCTSMTPGAARNALDCALWDLEAKRAGSRVWKLAGLPKPKPCITAETIGIDTPEAMGAAAAKLRSAPLLKVKLGSDAVLTRMATVRENAPAPRIIIDPNESWTIDLLADVAEPLNLLGVEMIEQPLKAGEDDALADFTFPIPICADEACHTADGLPTLRAKYQMINVKLDKTGGLTEAIHLTRKAKDLGFGVMIGCMVGTSLAMAPATLLGAYAEFVDLDGPLLMKQDRGHGLDFTDGLVSAPEASLWG